MANRREALFAFVLLALSTSVRTQESSKGPRTSRRPPASAGLLSTASHKRFVTIKGHFAVFMNSSEFLKEMRALLTPGH
jgi:hypothetical protein